MKYFLIVYHRSAGRIVLGPIEYAESQRDEALMRRFALEKEYADKPDHEIVVLGSTSLENIKFTHGRYFMLPNDDLVPAAS